MSDKPVIEWENCYQEKYGALITAESTSHPAKMARGLVFKIYEYALERGYIKKGQWVLDPFFGVGCTALPALMHGINIWGNELEPLFTDCARGCDCTGISKTEWVRFFGRWRKFAYKNRHFCPQCISQAERPVKPTELPLSQAGKKRRARIAELEASLKDKGKPRRATLVNPIPFPEKFNHAAKQADMFGFVLEASYERNSYTIPCTTMHHYTGNLENWQKYAKGDAVAVCTMGDSRQLTSIIQEQVGGLVSSPPFNDSLAHKINANDTTNLGVAADGSKRGGSFVTGDYGDSPAQLGNMPAGQFDSVVSSPPYIDTDVGGSGGEGPGAAGNVVRRSRIKAGNPNEHAAKAIGVGYGQEEGQLGSLTEGSFDSIISSSPFADSIGSDDPDKRGGLYRDERRRNDTNLTSTYGDSEGQLGKLKDEGFDASIGSPPFAQSMNSTDENFINKHHKDIGRSPNSGGAKSLYGSYGSEPGQLGTMKDEGFDLSVGSPPYANSMDSEQSGIDPSKFKQPYGKTTQALRPTRYGEKDGQLGSMADEGFDLSVSSPPFAGNSGGRGDASRNSIDPALFDRSSGGMKRGTGDSEDNLDHLSMTGFDSAVSSPPFEDSLSASAGINTIRRKQVASKLGKTQEQITPLDIISPDQKEYGYSPNQLGNSTGPTFWQAARDILLECYKLLKPGAYSFWVVKNYVKSGRIVNFVDQWRMLCEACGFEHTETIIAWQTEDKGTNYDLDGEKQKKIVRRQSFFRLLHIKNHPELAIDSEIVLVMRKHL